MTFLIRLFLVSFLFFLFPFFSLVANAGDVFFDGFESGDFSNWTSVGQNWDTVRSGVPYAHSGSERAEVKGNVTDSILLKQISTSGYQGIVLSYWYKIGKGLEDDDHVVFEWSLDGSSWNQLEDFTNVSEGDWLQKSYVLPSSAANNPNFTLRFRATLGAATSDIFRLDDVYIQGNIIEQEPSSTPLPTPSATPTPTSTPTPTPIPIPTSLPTGGSTSTSMPTSTPTATATVSPTPTVSASPAPSTIPLVAAASSAPPSQSDFSGIYINEMMPNPEGTDQGNEWIEIYNSSGSPIDLKGLTLEDRSGKSYVISAGVIIPLSGFLLFYSSKTAIALNNNGDSLKLFSPASLGKTLISEAVYQNSKSGYSIARNSAGQYEETKKPTPGAANIFEKDKSESSIVQETVKQEAETRELSSDLSKEGQLGAVSLGSQSFFNSPTVIGVIALFVIIFLSLVILIKSGII